MKYLDDAKKQLKRLDHSVYVSLKYTRTVDMLQSIIEGMINTINPLLDAILEFEVENKRIKEFPTNIPLKCKKIREIYSENQEYGEIIEELIKFYLFLRKISRLEDYKKINEYRRHVAYIGDINGEETTINLDLIHEYYDNITNYVNKVTEIIYGKEEEF